MKGGGGSNNKVTNWKLEHSEQFIEVNLKQRFNQWNVILKTFPN